MAHETQLQFVELLSASIAPPFRNSRVLEVGSLDINGSIRRFFHDCDYVGLDIAVGPGVDIVCQGQDFDDPSGSFDLVISCEAMEHNPYWVGTLKNMIRLCRPDGLVIMTCATTGRPEHGTARSSPKASPLTVESGWNYYRNLTEVDLRRAIDLAESFEEYRFWTNWNHYDLLFAGIKRSVVPLDDTRRCWANACTAIDAWIRNANGARVPRYRAVAARFLGERWFKAMHRVAEIFMWLHRPR